MVLWNADQQNLTKDLNTFHDGALHPASNEPGDMKRWIEGRLSHIAKHRHDTFLEVVGGETAFSRVATWWMKSSKRAPVVELPPTNPLSLGPLDLRHFAESSLAAVAELSEITANTRLTAWGNVLHRRQVRRRRSC